MKLPAQINYDNLTSRIFSLNPSDAVAFEELALEIFSLQFQYNPLYQIFCNTLHTVPGEVTGLKQIPFLPISFFKNHCVITQLLPETQATIFTSSGTTGSEASKHYVSDLSLYKKSFTRGFQLFYGDPADYCILALLPSYLEREGSSLVYMAKELITSGNHSESGFYLNEFDKLAETIHRLKAAKQKTILLGVSYALIDLAERGIKLNNDFIVMETGGMKGRRKEMLKSELHELLKQKLDVQHIHSEYGMTELLSQAYSKQDGLFSGPPWMQILIRDTNDPFTYLAHGRTGGINVIDLANINSCSFIATQDLGKKHSDGSFELMGRFDNSDLRGCNLLVE